MYMEYVPLYSHFVGFVMRQLISFIPNIFQVLLLSFAFLIVPNFNPFNDQDSLEALKSIPLPGKSRNLLHNGQSGSELADTENPYGITVRPNGPWEVPPKTPALPELKRATYTSSVAEEDEKKEKVVPEQMIYVQIEKAADSADTPSNLTLVSTEAEFKPPSNVKTKNSKEKVERRRDL